MMPETDGGRRCPVCDADIERNRPRCVRCESNLEAWWPLEESIRTIDEAAAAGTALGGSSGLDRGRYVVPIVVAAALSGFAIGWTALGVKMRVSAGSGTVSQEATQAEPSSAAGSGTRAAVPEPANSHRDVVTYYVQRGDTWWRLAKSFTGRGTNWRAVEIAANHVPLRSGAILHLDIAALTDPSSP